MLDAHPSFLEREKKPPTIRPFHPLLGSGSALSSSTHSSRFPFMSYAAPSPHVLLQSGVPPVTRRSGSPSLSTTRFILGSRCPIEAFPWRNAPGCAERKILHAPCTYSFP